MPRRYLFARTCHESELQLVGDTRDRYSETGVAREKDTSHDNEPEKWE